ncbi:MAG: DMT family transporter [Candidatus Heimdallarchaeota archaeon]|nr:DMT family transporter [Candidatus Heimdallarchaeota archaeon]
MVRSPNITNYILLLLTVIAWGASWPTGSIVAHALPALFAAFLRYTIALPVFILAAYILEKDRILDDTQPKSLKFHLKLVFLGSLQISLYNYFFLTGLKYTSSSDATLIIAINPTITAIVAALLYLDERLTKERITGLIIALLGVSLIVLQSPNQDVENRILGDAIILIAATVWAGFTSLSKPMFKHIKPLSFTALITFYGWLILGITAFIAYPSYFNLTVIKSLSNDVVYSLLFLAIFAAAFANISFNKSIGIIGPSRTAVFVNLVPIFGVLFSILLLGDAFSLFYILALLLIISGVYLVNKKKNNNTTEIQKDE